MREFGITCKRIYYVPPCHGPWNTVNKVNYFGVQYINLYEISFVIQNNHMLENKQVIQGHYIHGTKNALYFYQRKEDFSPIRKIGKDYRYL
jgi:hypothetical protein